MPITKIVQAGYNNNVFFNKVPYYSQFRPTSISNCQLWLDGADPAGNGVVPANSSVITTWTDKTGNGNSGTGGVSPTYSAPAKALIFDGSTTFLQTPVTAVPINETVFAVFTPTVLPTVANKLNDILGTNVNNGRDFSIFTSAAGNSSAYQLRYDSWAVGSIPLTSYGSVTYNTLTLATGQFTGGQGAGGTYGTTFGAFQSLAFSGAGTTRIGSGNGGDFFTGTINEILIFSRALSLTERQTIESYLSQKWTLTVLLPNTHLNFTFPAGSPTAIQPYTTSIKTVIGVKFYPPGIPTISSPTNTGNVTTLSMSWLAPSVTGTAGTTTGYIVYILAGGSLVSGTGIGTGGTQTLGNVLVATFAPMTTNLL